MDHNTYTLLDLNTHIKRVIALNFESEIWVKAEILTCTEKRGHVYLELIQKDEESHEIIAQMRATLWATDYQKIKQSNPDLADYFTAGFEIMCFALPVFHEKFGLQLKISNIDTAYVRGALDLRKEELFRQIKEEGLDLVNRRLPFPEAIRRIAVISSESAAGYKDFIKQIHENIYGFKYSITLFDSVMQGSNLESSISESFRAIESQKSKFDVVIIIRGGGSRADLAVYDNFHLAYLTAHFPLPVITGIGHEIDICAIDLTAGKALKTPTAVAAFLIDHNADYLRKVMDSYRQVIDQASRRMQHISVQAELLYSNIINSARQSVQNYRFKFERIQNQLRNSLIQRIQKHKYNLTLILQKIELANPLFILQKGYTIITQNGRRIKNSEQFKHNTETSIHWSDGHKKGVFKQIENEQKEK
ncbi:MAG: exodeoxyribonuclease VII large subunit [Saprospiraceae bacterium]|nr:exodeoxyribonuclease VII large subunit [Saprospiraceae bacterium]